MHFIAINDQVCDRSLGVGAIYRDAKSVTAASGMIAARKRLLDMMDVILQQLNVGARPADVDTQRRKPMFGGAKVANFEALNSHVTLAVNRHYAASVFGSEAGCVQDRRFSWIASESNESITRVARCIDT